MTRADSRSRGSYRTNLEALLSVQKPPRGTAAYSRLVNRPLGRRVAAAVHVVGMTPNQATCISAAMSGAAILLLALAEPSWWSGLLVSVLLSGGYVMDSVDGQLARLRKQRSLAGEWLDHTVDASKTSLLHLAVLVSWYRFPPVDDVSVLLVPLGYEVVQVVTYFGLTLMPTLRQKARTPQAPGEDGEEHWLRKWLILPTDYGVLCWVFVLLGAPALFVGAYTALALLSAVMLLLALRKWWRELRDLDRAVADDR